MARKHEGVRYQCEKCKKYFSTESYRNTHQETCPGTVFGCGQCDQQFANRTALQLHQRAAHRPAEQPTRKRKPDDAQPSTSRDSPSQKRQRSEKVELDPIQPEPAMLPQGDDELNEGLREEYRDHWSAIRTTHRTRQRVQDVYNFRLEGLDLRALYPQLQAMFNQQKSRFKINVSFGFVLRNSETAAFRYYHSSHNQGRMLEAPILITSQEDFNQFLDTIAHEDILEWARQQRPNTKWVVVMVTNMTVFINKLPDHPIGCPNLNLPEYIKNNKFILGMDKHMKRHIPYNDQLCFFRCVAVQQGVSYKESQKHLEDAVRHLFDQLIGGNPAQFDGVNLKDIPELEKKLEMCINVYQLVERDGIVVAELVQRSYRDYKEVMNLNLFEEHFSLITNMDQYVKSFRCTTCGKLWKTYRKLNKHQATCEAATKKDYPGGVYRPEPTVFDLLEQEGIMVDEEDRYYPYRIVFDFECYFDKQHIPASTEKLEWKAKHEPLSVSVKSNTLGFTETKCFITGGEPEVLVHEMLTYMLRIQDTAQAIMREVHQDSYNQLLELIEHRKGLEPSKDEPMEVDGEDTVVKKHPLEKIKSKYEAWLAEVPTIGFNSGKYDLNVIKTYLVKSLKEANGIQYVIKKSNALMCIKTEKLIFLDIRNYLAPNYSYSNYIKAYNCKEGKGFFPYEWMDELDKLNQTTLPDHKEFFSSLKNANISTDEYAYCQRVWQENNMTSFRDYLEWYNGLDVDPFMEALGKQFGFYKGELHLDMFKDGISVPGLTLKYLFNTIDPTETTFTLFDKYNSDVHDLIKEWNVGGPSIVFNRYQEAGVTKINEHLYGAAAKLCESVVGYDANSLYLACLMEEMPTGLPIRRKAEENFAPKQSDVFGRMACEWLEWEAYQMDIKITHKYNGKEKRIGQRQLPVDGYCAQTNTCYQFHGDIWHGCECQGKKVHPKNGKSMTELREETKKNSDYIRQCGYNLVELWECEWKEMKALEPALRKFIATRYRRPLDKKRTMTQAEVLQAIVDGKLFGLVQCDLETPEELKAHFEEMTPIFKNTNISREDIGETMKAYAEANNLMSQPRRSLIGSYHAKGILLSTPMLRWYVMNGLTVTHIYQTIEYTPQACFKEFGDKVSTARRQGDMNQDSAIIADTMKLLGNSGYGKTITNLDKHREILYCDDKEAPEKINEAQFRKLNTLDEELYEVEMSKKKIKYNLPVAVGFFVYQYAKLKMLDFYFGCLLKYCSREDFCYVEMDTDSAYLGLSGNSLEDIVKPEMKKEFYEEWDKWFPSEACPTHKQDFVSTKLEGKEWEPTDCCKEQKKFDRRTPGLMKIEWKGKGMIALCSKCYFGWGEDGEKKSTKGISKAQNKHNMENFKEVLRTQVAQGGYNTGFQVKDNVMYTYKQWRSALSYLYPKRQVLQDGVSSVPLLI